MLHSTIPYQCSDEDECNKASPLSAENVLKSQEKCIAVFVEEDDVRNSSLVFQESRRSGSFTFAPVSARSNDMTAFAARRRATSSEPCEALSFPRLGSTGPSHLRHGSSMPSSQVLLLSVAHCFCKHKLSEESLCNNAGLA